MYTIKFLYVILIHLFIFSENIFMCLIHVTFSAKGNISEFHVAGRDIFPLPY